MADRQACEGRRASAPLTACMVTAGQDVLRLASRFMADSMTLVRIAGALSVGDRAVFGRMERYLQNNKAGLGEMRAALTMLRAAAVAHDPEFAAKNEAGRKVARRRQMERREGERQALFIGLRAMEFGAGAFDLAALGAAVRDEMIRAEFPALTPAAGAEAWLRRYRNQSAGDILACYVCVCFPDDGLDAPDHALPARAGNVIRPAFGARSQPDLSA